MHCVCLCLSCLPFCLSLTQSFILFPFFTEYGPPNSLPITTPLEYQTSLTPLTTELGGWPVFAPHSNRGPDLNSHPLPHPELPFTVALTAIQP